MLGSLLSPKAALGMLKAIIQKEVKEPFRDFVLTLDVNKKIIYLQIPELKKGTTLKHDTLAAMIEKQLPKDSNFDFAKIFYLDMKIELFNSGNKNKKTVYL